MKLLNIYYIWGNVNFTAPLKRTTFIFLIWIYLTYNDMCKFPKSIEKIYVHNKISNINFTRLLARYKHNREFKHNNLRLELSDRTPYKIKRNTYDYIPANSQVKGKETHNIDLYMKNYKNRYIRKKGLSKLDCYYENKVFRKFCDISDIAKKMKYDEKRSTRFFLKKYGIGLILFAIMPVLGLLYPILFGGDNLPGIFGLCTTSGHKDSNGGHKEIASPDTPCNEYWLYKNGKLINIVGHFYIITYVIISIIVLLVFIYIFAKVIKYERIKSGKGKMNRKEYIKYCKEVFNL